MADITQKDIEYFFQEEVLEKHGKFLSDLLRDTLKEKDIRVSSDLLKGISYSVVSEGNNRTLRMNFFTYGRFIEIRRHRYKNAQAKLNQIETNTNALLYGIKENRAKPKNTGWYSKNAYGSLNRLISILMYELSDQEVARLKGILQNKKIQKR